jgi:DNA-binding response OmpR family regulator
MGDPRKTVLLVDDDRVLVALFANALGNAGYRVDTAHDGIDALDHYQARHPDLVVLDGNMPRKDGWSTLEEIRAGAAPPPVVMISSTPDRARARRLGAARCLPKPFRIDELISTCRDLIG